MEPIAKILTEELKSTSFFNPAIPVYMNGDGNPVTDGLAKADLMVKQDESPAQWVKTLKNMQEDGIDTFIECGAGRTPSGLVKKRFGSVKRIMKKSLPFPWRCLTLFYLRKPRQG